MGTVTAAIPSANAQRRTELLGQLDHMERNPRFGQREIDMVNAELDAIDAVEVTQEVAR